MWSYDLHAYVQAVIWEGVASGREHMVNFFQFTLIVCLREREKLFISSHEHTVNSSHSHKHTVNSSRRAHPHFGLYLRDKALPNKIAR